MTKEEVYNVWAPPEARWSAWVKPVLFATMDRPYGTFSPTSSSMDWAPLLEMDLALVLDLPGSDGVLSGVALAARGYRPVPLYNSVPAPGLFLTPGTPTSLIDVWPILTALWAATDSLSQASLPLDAPPVFLLDANRRGDGQVASPGRFDNRSISFVTDFPSANFLVVHGIRRVRLIQSGRDDPQPDLAHTLRQWQEGGLVIELQRVDIPGSTRAVEIGKPSGFGSLWHRALSLMGLRRHGLGGFGGFIPEPSSG